MKTFFSLFLSLFCVLTIAQAQSLDSPSPWNPALDYLNAEGVETVFEVFANIASVEESAIAARPLGCTCLGDINRDGNLNLLDVSLFVTAVQQGLNDPCADMNGDGNVDLLDVDPFVEALKTGGCGS